MGYDRADVYYQPEAFELEPVAEIDYSSGSYEFDLRVVWRHKVTNRFFTARDSGCSCPSPFEDYTADSTNEVDPLDYGALEEEVQTELENEYSYLDANQAADFLTSVRKAMDATRRTHISIDADPAVVYGLLTGGTEPTVSTLEETLHWLCDNGATVQFTRNFFNSGFAEGSTRYGMEVSVKTFVFGANTHSDTTVRSFPVWPNPADFEAVLIESVEAVKNELDRLNVDKTA